MLPATAVYITIHAIRQYVSQGSIDWHNRIHTSKCSSLTGHALCLSPRFIKYSMKTSASFKEKIAFSSAVMTRLTWRYRDRELITASSFKLLKAGNMSWILGLDSKSLKQNHSRTSLLTLNNGNSTYVYFRYKLYSYFASYAKKSRHREILTTRHSFSVMNFHSHPQ